MTGRRGRWGKGESGNPRGRPRGIVDRRAKLREAIAGELPAIVASLIERAKLGDTAAAALLVSRVLAPAKPEAAAVRFAMPADGRPADLARSILAAVAAGTLAPDVGKQLVDAVAGVRAIEQIDELAARVAALESTRGQHDE